MSQCSQPLAYRQRPLKRKPPSTGVACPVGISDEQISVVLSLPQTSCADAVVVERHQPGMDADHAVDPGDRHVALAERHLDVEVGVDVQLVAAPALGLQHLEQAGRLHVGDGFLGDAALALALRRARGAAPGSSRGRARSSPPRSGSAGGVQHGAAPGRSRRRYFSSSTVLKFARHHDLEHLAVVGIVEHLVLDAVRLQPGVAGLHGVDAVALRTPLVIEPLST